MTVDHAGYAAVARDAIDHGAELHRFRDPLGDERYVAFGEPIAMTVTGIDDIAAVADDHPDYHATEDHLAVARDGRMLATYDRATGDVTVDGDILLRVMHEEEPGRVGRIRDAVHGARNPLYRRGRAAATDQDLSEADEWIDRQRRTSYGALAFSLGTLASGGYGVLTGDPTFLHIGGALAAAEAGFLGTYGAYSAGGTDAVREKMDARTADDIDETAGDTVVHVDAHRVVEDWVDAVDPDTDTPDWIR